MRFAQRVLAGLGLVVAVSLLGSTACGGSPTATPDALAEATPGELGEVLEVWRSLRQDYIEPDLNETELGRGAILGLLEALDDPYTIFVEPDQFELQLEELEGSFEGIGATVGLRGGRIVIVAPIRDSPAEGAGLRAGDTILAIDGDSTEGMSLADAVSRVRGPSGTVVMLRIGREAADPREVTIVRAEVVIPTVRVERLPGEIAHVTLASFGSHTAGDLREALRGLDPGRISGIILDLRNNPGGLLEAAVAVASEFLPDGLVLYEVDRSGSERAHEVTPGGTAARTPLVVLVNHGSASGSEVVAGALQARGRSPLVGERTFGKGSVTVLRRLSSGAGLYITTSRWLTPDRRLIEGAGLDPDVLVQDDPTTEEIDEQLQRAHQELQRLLAASPGLLS